MASETKPRTGMVHCCLDVRGALRWSNARLRRLLRDENGKWLTADAARAYLLDQLQEGRRVLPIGDACDGFDYKSGCPGHAKEVRDGVRSVPVSRDDGPAPEVGSPQRCRSDRDGDCYWRWCPQNRDGEPVRSGRSCPLYDWDGEEDELRLFPYPTTTLRGLKPETIDAD